MEALINHTLGDNGQILYGPDLIDTSRLDLLTNEQLQELEIDSLKFANMNMALSVSQKTMMNSIYGATANEFYYFSCVPAAECVTAEGRHYIHAGERIINNWLRNTWHTEHDLHKQLREHDELKDFFDVSHKEVTQILTPDEVMYIDTDSIYVSFEALFKSIGFDTSTGAYARFIMILNDLRLRKLFADELGAEIAERHGENHLKFDLESISEATFFVKKKKYVMSYKMEDDKIYDDATNHIKGKGVEIIQSGSTNEIKKMLKFLIVHLFKDALHNDNYKGYMRYMFKMFCELPIEHRSKLQNSNSYANAINHPDSNYSTWTANSGAGAEVKGMAEYNAAIYNNNLADEFRWLTGGKIAWYYCVGGNAFAYHIDEWPGDFNGKYAIDNVAQFHKLIADPISRIAVLKGIDVTNPLAATTTQTL